MTSLVGQEGISPASPASVLDAWLLSMCERVCAGNTKHDLVTCVESQASPHKTRNNCRRGNFFETLLQSVVVWDSTQDHHKKARAACWHIPAELLTWLVTSKRQSPSESHCSSPSQCPSPPALWPAAVLVHVGLHPDGACATPLSPAHAPPTPHRAPRRIARKGLHSRLQATLACRQGDRPAIACGRVEKVAGKRRQEHKTNMFTTCVKQGLAYLPTRIPFQCLRVALFDVHCCTIESHIYTFL